MSLVAFAARICLWRALLGRTYAEDRVHDSSIKELGGLLSDNPKPFLVVSTDDDEGQVDGHNFSDAPRKLNVVIEVVVGSAVKLDGPSQLYEMRVPATDEGFEQSLDFITRQIMRVIQADDGIFADLFRSFTPGDKTFSCIRGGETTPRYAARQIVIACDTLCEPAFGEAPADEWARLIEAFADDTILAPLAPMLKAEIIGEALPDWRKLQASLGLTRAGQLAAGLGPLLPGETPGTFTEATIDADHITVVVAP